MSINEFDYFSNNKVTYSGIFFIPIYVTYLGLDSYLILLLFQKVHAGCKLLISLLGSTYLQGLESQYPVLPQQTNSTFIILSFSPVKMYLLNSLQEVQTGCKSQLCLPLNQVFMRFHDNRLVSCRGIRIVLLSSFITSMSRDYRITLCIYSNLTTIYFNIPIFSLLFYNSIGITYFFLAPFNNIHLIES